MYTETTEEKGETHLMCSHDGRKRSVGSIVAVMNVALLYFVYVFPSSTSHV
jgi:hypothetical protein